jgi:hypothetical protein
MYNGPIIRSDPAKINKKRRRKIRIPMIMDKMEGHINRLPTRGRERSSITFFIFNDVVFILLLELPEQFDFICCYNILIFLRYLRII